MWKSSSSKYKDQLSTIEKLFIRASGASVEILQDIPLERAKYFGIGGAIITTSLFAGLTGAYFFSLIFKMQEITGESYNFPIYIALGLLWGLLIFNLDRYIVSTVEPIDFSSIGADLNNLIPLAPVVVRFLLAIVIAIIVSEPIKLFVFRKDIEPQVKDNFIETRKNYYNTQKTNTNTEIQTLTADRTISKNNISEDKKSDLNTIGQFNTESKQINHEINRIIQMIKTDQIQLATNTKTIEYYDQLIKNHRNSQQKRESSQTEKRKLESENKTLGETISNFQKQLDHYEQVLTTKKKLTQQISDNISQETINKIINDDYAKTLTVEGQRKHKLTSDLTRYNNKLQIENLEKEYKDEKDNIGLLARINAYERIIGTKSLFLRYFFTFLFILIDVIPLLVKLIGKKGTYEEVVEFMNLANKQDIKIELEHEKREREIANNFFNIKANNDEEIFKEALIKAKAAKIEVSKLLIEEWKESENPKNTTLYNNLSVLLLESEDMVEYKPVRKKGESLKVSDITKPLTEPKRIIESANISTPAWFKCISTGIIVFVIWLVLIYFTNSKWSYDNIQIGACFAGLSIFISWLNYSSDNLWGKQVKEILVKNTAEFFSKLVFLFIIAWLSFYFIKKQGTLNLSNANEIINLMIAVFSGLAGKVLSDGMKSGDD